MNSIISGFKSILKFSNYFSRMAEIPRLIIYSKFSFMNKHCFLKKKDLRVVVNYYHST